MNEVCKTLFEKMSEYLDGELDPDTISFAERHISECTECEENLELMKKSLQLIKKQQREKIPDDVRNQLRQAIQKEMKRVE
jgi:mycothiol system anti-sigma-R factor